MAERDPLTYADAGVDIEAQDEAVAGLAGALGGGRTGLGAPLEGVGNYAGLVDLGDRALVMCTDGVGTKLLVADAVERWDTIGIDCIAMNVNDAICVGAEPLAFVDYLAVEEPSRELSRELGKGLARGAKLANVSIVGGETAVLPEVIRGFDIAGTCVGVVDKDRIITGKDVAPGDAIVGVASSGIHSNGYTLARRAAEEAGISYDDEVVAGTTLGELFLEPTRIYVEAVLDLLDEVPVKGLAHITGGGLLNLPRIREDVRYVLEDPLEVPTVFDLIQRWGNVATDEMHRTFNMGMGLAVVVDASHGEAAASVLDQHFPSRIVGHVAEGEGVAVPPRDLTFDAP